MKELIERATKINAELVAKLKELEELEGESAKPDFEKGDWVLITKPKDVQQKPYWSYYMDKYDGQTLEIEEINSDGYLVIDEWEFNSEWCTKVGAPKSKPMVNKLKECFKNTTKAQVVKDWETTTTREFDKTPKPNKLEVGDICIFWDDNKSDAVIGELTEINNKSDFPYEVADILGYKNCIPCESGEQYLEFINE